MARNAEQVAQQQIERLNADPVVQQLCVQWLNQVGHDPRVQQLCAGARTPFEAYVRVMAVADPATLEGDITHIVGLQDQEYGPVQAARVADQVPPAQAQATGGIDWARELPAAAVAQAWAALPAHSRLRQTAKSPQFEAMARRDLARMGGETLPGLTPGQTMAAYLHFAGKHSKALASGDRAVYDSLARRIGGALGDGESLRVAVDGVKKIHRDDYVLNRVAEKGRVAEAEAAKYRARPVENPTYHPKKIPQGALTAKERPPDGTRAEVARQLARQKAGWELPEKRRGPEPLRMTIHDRDHFHTAWALAKVKGDPPERVLSRLAPGLRKQMIEELRSNGYEPAAASSRASSGGDRHWVPAASNPSSGSTSSDAYSGGGYSGGGSGEATSEAPAAAGTGQ